MDDRKKTYTPGVNEDERRKRWRAACRLSNLNITSHTRNCSAHFEGGLGPTKLNPVPTIFSFPTHLQPKTQRKRAYSEERRRGALNCLCQYRITVLVFIPSQRTSKTHNALVQTHTHTDRTASVSQLKTQ